MAAASFFKPSSTLSYISGTLTLHACIEGEIQLAVTENDITAATSAPNSDDDATSMWRDYSAVFPSLHERGRELARADEWNFTSYGAY